MKIYHILSVIMFCSSCMQIATYNNEIEQALCKAGKNRTELEHVLNHYKDDSLKHLAATYLIINMGDKYTLEHNTRWEDEATYLYRWNKINNNDSALIVYNVEKTIKKYDLEYITADYLINNIDLAFKVWEEISWGKHISFDVFCEEILPYRVAHEPLENWRERILVSFADLYQYFISQPDITTEEACTMVNNQLPRFTWVNYPMPSMNYSMLMTTPRGTCDEMSALALFTMRALGIPVVSDFTPFWPYRNIGHAWNAVRTEKGEYVSFMGAETNPNELHLGNNMLKSKVYRHTFKTQTDNNCTYTTKMNGTLDVTHYYKNTSKLNVPISFCSSIKTDTFLLQSINSKNNSIIGYATNKNDSLNFGFVGDNVTYQIFDIQNGNIEAVSSPFFITKNEIHIYENEGIIGNIKIDNIAVTDPFLYRMQNGQFEGANNSDFSDKELLFRVNDMPNAQNNIVGCISTKKYRYVRFVSPQNGHCNVAEIAFLDKNNHQINGNVIGTEGSWYNSTMTKDKAFDNDISTFFDAQERDYAWTGLDLGSPQRIYTIKYVPRTANHTLNDNHIYEVYQNINTEWKVVDKKKPKNGHFTIQLHQNGLYYLRDANDGTTSDFLFDIKNGNVRWIKWE